MKKLLINLGVLFVASPAFSAIPIHLDDQPAYLLRHTAVPSTITMKETSRSTDFNNTLHIRIAQTYQGYAVWGGDAIIHFPQLGNSTKPLSSLLALHNHSNGIVYEGLQQDLFNAPTYLFSTAHKEQALTHSIHLYQNKSGKDSHITDSQSQLIIYLDEHHIAHWAFYIKFFAVSKTHAMPKNLAYIIDAVNFQIYQHWDDLKTLDTVAAGGWGGNHKTGQKTFDGLEGHAQQLYVQRDATTGICQMRTDTVVVKDYRAKSKVVGFPCISLNVEHNNIYWNANFDAIATSWSPSNDAMFGAMITKQMYQSWYNLPVLVKAGKPMLILVTVHLPDTNAYWAAGQATFGDSLHSKEFNPFTSLDTVAHELSHGFTEQHSQLAYYGQSGGLNEAFSDMAGIAAEFFAYGKTDFLIGWGDIKTEDRALRYMDKPSKDCYGDRPGSDCSIDHVSQYSWDMNVHHSSGIFNHVYYLLAIAPGWNAKQAFDVMVQANAHYWTSTASFAQAACGVMKAAQDYHYDLNVPAHAFNVVGIDTRNCIKN
ncbi:MAG: hypothetical protein A3E83_06380 [Gammaproteobacteria bacterium RIFCSPHIGHO2_12_FULL_41_20]|nr:MAG: hypothetical protein A3E83_06380 [Gammaproteobacteria bacterium RIFCSPHIGHO2_12_FULL_41_20]